MIRIALIEDDLAFRQTFKYWLESVPKFEVVFESDCGKDLENWYDPEKIDLVLLDLRLKGQHGAPTCRNLRKKYPEIKIIVLSQYDDHEIILALIREGASAFLTKDSDLERIRFTIEMVMQLNYFFDMNIGELMVEEMRLAHKRALIGDEFRAEFTETEMRIATMCCSGLTNEQIGEQLNLNKRTIEHHRSIMQLKTNCTNFQSVIIYMFKHYLLFPQQF